jgi:hypothetical protein
MGRLNIHSLGKRRSFVLLLFCGAKERPLGIGSFNFRKGKTVRLFNFAHSTPKFKLFSHYVRLRLEKMSNLIQNIAPYGATLLGTGASRPARSQSLRGMGAATVIPVT